jgi:uncharacterized membrane protein
VAWVLTAAGAAFACGLELLEALAIVLAVAVTRRPREALLGALAAVLACAVLAALAGPVLAGSAAGNGLKIVVGAALLLFGMEWLRKGVLRLSGRRSRSSSYAEFVEEREALEAQSEPVPGSFDWPGAVISFKGVLLEGVEVVLIVTALAARPGGLAPALTGAAAAVVLTLGIGIVLHRPLQKLPETELKYAVGLVLTTFGTFFASEGLGVRWPLGDVALLYLLAWWLVVSQVLAHRLARGGADAGPAGAPAVGAA